MRHINHKKILHRDIAIVILSIFLALFMVRVGILENILSITNGYVIISSFIAGIFFTSVFTLAPASVALAKLALMYPTPTVALWGALGAAMGDLVIFLFIRDTVSDDIDYVAKKIHLKKWLSLFHLGFLRILSPLIGAAIIASPLPDELGITLMGISRMKTYYMIPIAFVMNFIGILLIAAIAKAV